MLQRLANRKSVFPDLSPVQRKATTIPHVAFCLRVYHAQGRIKGGALAPRRNNFKGVLRRQILEGGNFSMPWLTKREMWEPGGFLSRKMATYKSVIVGKSRYLVWLAG